LDELNKTVVHAFLHLGRYAEAGEFARGAVGENRGLNFFIDSGLVSLHPEKVQLALFLR